MLGRAGFFLFFYRVQLQSRVQIQRIVTWGEAPSPLRQSVDGIQRNQCTQPPRPPAARSGDVLHVPSPTGTEAGRESRGRNAVSKRTKVREQNYVFLHCEHVESSGFESTFDRSAAGPPIATSRFGAELATVLTTARSCFVPYRWDPLLRQR